MARMPVTKGDSELADRDLYSGLIRLHILHQAAAEPIFGLGMAEDLAGRGYRIGLGTLYPARTKVRELFGELIEGE
jgi:hypothetical protein